MQEVGGSSPPVPTSDIHLIIITYTLAQEGMM